MIEIERFREIIKSFFINKRSLVGDKIDMDLVKIIDDIRGVDGNLSIPTLYSNVLNALLKKDVAMFKELENKIKGADCSVDTEMLLAKKMARSHEWIALLEDRSGFNSAICDGWIELLNEKNIKPPLNAISVRTGKQVSMMLAAVMAGAETKFIADIIDRMEKWNTQCNWAFEIVEIADAGRVDVLDLLYQKNKSWFTSNPSASSWFIDDSPISRKVMPQNDDIELKAEMHRKKMWKFGPAIGAGDVRNLRLRNDEVVEWVVRNLCNPKKMTGIRKYVESYVLCLIEQEKLGTVNYGDGWHGKENSKIRLCNYQKLLSEMDRVALKQSVSVNYAMEEKKVAL